MISSPATPQHFHPPRTHRAFLLPDAVIGIILALGLLMLMTATVARQRHAEQRLDKIRALDRKAEAAMLALVAGAPAPAPANARIENLPDPAPAYYHWVRLTFPAADGLPARSLVGLVPIAPDGDAP